MQISTAKIEITEACDVILKGFDFCDDPGWRFTPLFLQVVVTAKQTRPDCNHYILQPCLLTYSPSLSSIRFRCLISCSYRIAYIIKLSSLFLRRLFCLLGTAATASRLHTILLSTEKACSTRETRNKIRETTFHSRFRIRDPTIIKQLFVPCKENQRWIRIYKSQFKKKFKYSLKWVNVSIIMENEILKTSLLMKF